MPKSGLATFLNMSIKIANLGTNDSAIKSTGCSPHPHDPSSVPSTQQQLTTDSKLQFQRI